MLFSKKWALSSIELLTKLSGPAVTLSFQQMFEIDKHAFGILELHSSSGHILSVADILANNIKCAILETDANRFKKGKNTKSPAHPNQTEILYKTEKKN